ncbi:MAG: hypothetical protein ACKVZH_15185 [Blastocatellia bacterium]
MANPTASTDVAKLARELPAEATEFLFINAVLLGAVYLRRFTNCPL